MPRKKKSMSGEEVEIREYKKVDLRGGTVIDGLPSISLSNAIAANYLVSSLKLDQVAVIDSPAFPPVSMIFANKPKFPARVYVSESLRLAVFLSEFSIPPELSRTVGRAMFNWARKEGCSLIISPLALPVTRERAEGLNEVTAVGSTDSARKLLADAAIKPMQIGVIAGVSAVLLNEGRWNIFDVVSLLVPISNERETHLAAATMLETINRFLPQLNIDVAPLYEEASKIEKTLKVIRTQARPVETRPRMYE